MKKRYYVIDAQENMPSWGAKTEKAEDFPTKLKAMKRAFELAQDMPHCAFFICETTDYVVAEVKHPQLIAMK
jgi:hypothetical protein